jgi:hypothetical protein
VTAPARRGRREEPPPAPGTVTVRVQGRPEDVDAYLAELQARETPGRRRVWRSRRYEDSNGVTVRQYVTVDLRDQPPS